MKKNISLPLSTIALTLLIYSSLPIACSLGGDTDRNAVRVSYSLKTRPAQDKSGNSVLVWILQNTGKKPFEISESFSPWTINNPQTQLMGVVLKGGGMTIEPVGIPPGNDGLLRISIGPRETITRVVQLNQVFHNFDTHLKDSPIVVFWAHTLAIKGQGEELIVPSVGSMKSGSSIFKKR